MKTVFESAQQTALDYKAVFLAASTARREAREILAAVDARLTAEKAQAEARAAELSAQLRDTDRPETVKRIARAELEALGKLKQGPSIVEAEAFDDALSELTQAITDAAALREKLADLFRESQTALVELRAESLGNQAFDPELLRRHPGELQSEWDRLCKKWEAAG